MRENNNTFKTNFLKMIKYKKQILEACIENGLSNEATRIVIRAAGNKFSKDDDLLNEIYAKLIVKNMSSIFDQNLNFESRSVLPLIKGSFMDAQYHVETLRETL